MASEPKGNILVPVWVDAGVVKALVDNNGKLPCAVDISGQSVDISGQAVVVSGTVETDISGQTVDISGQSVDISGEHVRIDGTVYTASNLYGYTGSQWNALLTYENVLRVRLHSQDQDIEVKQQTPADLTPGVNTWDGSAWQKQPIIWSYSDRYLTQQQNVSDVAATFTINLPEVPAGEVWRIVGIGVYRDTNINQFARIQQWDGGAAVSIEDIAIPTLGWFFNSSRELVLRAEDNIRVQYTGATVGETVITGAWGYKMSVSS